MKKTYFLFAILAIFLFVALLTNPSLARQKEIVKEELKTYIGKSLSEKGNSDSEDVLGALGVNIGTFFGSLLLDPLLDTILRSDNFVLFSTTKVIWEGKEEIVGIAAFNNIFFFKDIEDLNEEFLKDI